MTTPQNEIDETLVGELAYLETLLTQRPAVTPIVLGRLGELGVEARLDLGRLRAERTIKLARIRAEKRKSQLSARVAAAAAIAVTVPALTFVPPAVAAPDPAPATAATTSFQVAVRITDQSTGKPLSGVKIKTVSEEVVAVTDAKGNATLPSAYAEEPVLSLEREGYPMVLVEGAKLTGHNMIAMARFSDGKSLAVTAPKVPQPGSRPGPSALQVDPAERLMALALEHSRPQTMLATADTQPGTAVRIADAPALGVDTAPPAREVLKPAVPAKPAVTLPVVPKPPAVAAAPPAPSTTLAAIPTLPHTAKPPAMTRAAQAPNRVVRIANADARSARTTDGAGAKPDGRAQKNVVKVASADIKAPRALRVVTRPFEDLATTPAARPDGMLDQPHNFVPAPVAVAHMPIHMSFPAIPKPAALLPAPARAAVARTGEAVSPTAVASLVHSLPSRPVRPARLVMVPHGLVFPAGLNVNPGVARAIAALKLPASPLRPVHIEALSAPSPIDAVRERVAAVTAKPVAPIQRAPLAVAAVKPALAQLHAAVASVAGRYAVKGGDTLSAIAERELGHAALWPVLYAANRDKLTNPSWLPIGINLQIPRTTSGLTAAGAQSYVVQSGDTLSKIAKEQLGDTRKWPQIFASNRHIIKNPWLIFPGQRLVLPVKVASGISESWADLAASAAPPAAGGSRGHSAD